MVHQINRENSLNLYIIDLLLIRYIHHSEGKKKKYITKKNVRFRYKSQFSLLHKACAFHSSFNRSVKIEQVS